MPEDGDPAIARFLGATAWLPIPAKRSGYLCRVDSNLLIELAERFNAVLRMEYAPGDFCVVGMPLVSLASVPASTSPRGEVENRRALLDSIDGEDQDDEAKIDQLARNLDGLYSFGRNRTVGQDVGFGIQQIVDVALKALSPGVNETTTAVTCIHHLTVINSRLASRKIETRQRAKDGRLRVIAKRPTFESILDQSFDEIRRNAEGNVTILEELLAAMETIGVFARDDHRRRSVLRHVDAIAELADRSVMAPSDRAVMEPRIRQVLESLSDPNAGSWTMGAKPSNAVTAREGRNEVNGP